MRNRLSIRGGSVGSRIPTAGANLWISKIILADNHFSICFRRLRRHK